MPTKRAWKKNHSANPLYIVGDGEECLDYLHRRRRYSKPGAAPRQGILLLDIKMPKMDGLAVLKHIREDKALCHLPVVMLTTINKAGRGAENYYPYYPPGNAEPGN